VRAWVAELSAELAPATTVNAFRWFATIRRAAVTDRLIPMSPCDGVKLPRIERDLIVPFTTEQVLELVGAAPERFRALVVTAASSGLRQGELLGLDVARVDWLGRTIRVDRQLVTPAQGAPSFAPPKTGASRQVVPVADEVLAVLSEHVSASVPDGGLLFTSRGRAPLRRNGPRTCGARPWRARRRSKPAHGCTTFGTTSHRS
jgi:integrase